MYVCKSLHPTTAQYTLFSLTHRILTNIDRKVDVLNCYSNKKAASDNHNRQDVLYQSQPVHSDVIG